MLKDTLIDCIVTLNTALISASARYNKYMASEHVIHTQYTPTVAVELKQVSMILLNNQNKVAL